nr:immunoglobulin heavy chain junction region [Mus musculus]
CTVYYSNSWYFDVW